ncbi:MAG: DegT/DnrJ/EryC1/StrS family aminotransferase [Enhygromyxa sp.]
MTSKPPCLEFPNWPTFDDAERSALQAVLESREWWRGGGTAVERFETSFAAHHGAKAALALTNGTHALQLGLEVLGVGPGDEVLVPAFTFISTSMAVQRLGAIPVPVDVRLDDFNLDPARIAEALSPRTKAIVPVHMAGQIADLDGIRSACDDRPIAILQDAAHAHGAQQRGRKIGELGFPAAFSFQNYKLMTAGEGGALLFDDPEVHQRALDLHNCGRPLKIRTYDHALPGTNYRMTEFGGAVLSCQLQRLDAQNAQREARAAQLYAALERLPGVHPIRRRPETTIHSNYMAMFRIDPGPDGARRRRFVELLVELGVPAYTTYPVVYRTGAFWAAPHPDGDRESWAKRCPCSERAASEGVWLHHRVLLGDERLIDDLVGAIEWTLGELGG